MPAEHGPTGVRHSEPLEFGRTNGERHFVEAAQIVTMVAATVGPIVAARYINSWVNRSRK